MLIALIEHDNGQLTEASLQMLTLAERTARDMDAEYAALLIGEKARPLVEKLGAHGCSKVILAAHEGLTDYAPEAWAAALVEVLIAQNAKAAMAAGTDRGNEIMAHTAARLDLPLAANCAEINPGNPLKVVRHRWGGSLLEEAELVGSPWLLTTAMHVFPPLESSTPVEIALEEFSLQLVEKDFRVMIKSRAKDEVEGVNLKTARVVIGGGRGIGSSEGYSVLEELAGLLGAAVGGSRVATNNGWRSHADQIGLTGNRIAPDLYIACGISGAIQHLVGCKGAKKILVINNDPEAAFFSKADYGIVGDLFEVVPAISEEVKKARG